MKSFTVVVFIALVLATLAILTPVEANWVMRTKNTPGCETWDEESGVPWPDNGNNDVQDISWTRNCIR
ncbi:507_t:CDS:2 [Funneliformis caledonium]|uniref:507_t:CDS:1 n=1 Tax=Funneliformis caledonium TaxID=1117310 RepID=A0A9N9F3Z1_9GLOM|nr:507_t:CDS:2 [Funneliformis caledonium]